MCRRVAGIAATALIFYVLPAGALASAGPSIHKLTGSEYGISCPTMRVCYANGQVINGPRRRYTPLVGTIVKIVDGRQVQFRKIRSSVDTPAVSCPTVSWCGILVHRRVRPNATKTGFMTLSHGVLGKWTRVRWNPMTLSCPKAGECVLAGVNSTFDAIATAVFSGGKLSKPHYSKPWAGSGMVNAIGVACVSMSACEMVGSEDYTSVPRTYDSYSVAVRAGGRIGTVQTLHDNLGTSFDSISCLRSGDCWMAGHNSAGGVLSSVPIGGTPTQVAQTRQALNSISCVAGNLCTAWTTTGTSAPAIVSFTSGTQGAELTFSQLSSSGPSCVARISARKFIAIWDGHPNRTVLGTVG
jgi:hypothetical protein